MAKLTLSPISAFTQSAITTINQNMDDIETALEKTLSRDGTIPNQLTADLDVNHNDILNVDNLDADNIILNGEILIPGDISSVSAQGLLNLIKTVDGSGSGLDADTVDGLHASSFNTFVTTRTALKALDTTKNTVAVLTESGREGIFIWTTGDFSTHIAADTQEGRYIKATAIAATVGAWVRNSDKSVLHVKHFGAVCDGTADDTVAIQKTVDLCVFHGSGIVQLPAGNIKTTAAVNIFASSVTIAGMGEEITRMRPATASMEVFVFGDGTNAYNYVSVRDLAIIPTALIQTGVRVKNTFWCVIKNVKVNGSHNVGIEVDKGPAGTYLVIMQNVFTGTSSQYGCALGRQGTGSLLGVHMANCHFNGATNAGLRVESMSGMTWTGGETLGGGIGISLFPGASQEVRACLFSNLFIDTPATGAACDLGIGAAGRRISTIGFENCSFNNATTTVGVQIAGLSTDKTLIDAIRFTSCEFTANKQHGMYLTYCTNIELDNCNFLSNGFGGVGSGIFLSTDCDRVRIRGGSSGSGSGKAASQVYGVQAVATVTNLTIDDLDVGTGNVTGTINDASTNSRITNCVGYINQAKGAVTATTDALGDLTITHGMNVTPSVVVASRALAVSTGEAQPHTITSTNFKVRFWNSAGTPDASVSRSVMWSAYGNGALL